MSRMLGIAVLAFSIALSLSSAMAATSLKLAHASSEDSLIQQAVKQFKDQVEKTTNGSISITIYPNGQLGDEGPIAEGVGTGSIDIGLGGVIDAIDPKLGVVTLPFLFKDFTTVHRVLDGPIGEQLRGMGQDKGYRLLGFLDSGFRNFSNNRGPIKVPADMAGLKLRCPPNPVILETIK